jgi:arylsulfatase A-like enzyme
MRRLVSGAVLIAALAICTGAHAAARPNVLFIVVDDLNAWVGHLHGHPDARTPNIDRLAARGVAFTQAYAASAACNPSRVAMLSGLRPTVTGIYRNDQPWTARLENVVTLPQHFAANGYHVAAGGKIFHGLRLPEFGVPPPGAYFHEYFGEWGGVPDETARMAGHGLRFGRLAWGVIDAAPEEMGDYKLATWAEQQLAKKHDEPLFVMVGFGKPHMPWYLPKKYFDAHPLDQVALPAVKDDDLADVPPAGVAMAQPNGHHARVLRAGQWRPAVQAYLAAISFVDEQVGRVIDALDRSPDADRTIVVLWSDNGWHLGEKQHWRKETLWEEALHTPLIVVAPGLTAPNQRCNRPVDSMHIYPTLTDLTGLPLPEHVERESLRPLLLNPKGKWALPAVGNGGRGNDTIRTKRRRYIRYADGSEELYDHAKDPHEWRNLATDPATATERKRLAAWLPKDEAPEVPRVATTNDE